MNYAPTYSVFKVFSVILGIQCQQKGYILRGKIIDPSGTAKLSFELEVLYVDFLLSLGTFISSTKGVIMLIIIADVY